MTCLFHLHLAYIVTFIFNETKFLNTSENAPVSYLWENVVFCFLLLPASPDGCVTLEPEARCQGKSMTLPWSADPGRPVFERTPCLSPGKNEPEMKDAISMALPKKQTVLLVGLKDCSLVPLKER